MNERNRKIKLDPCSLQEVSLRDVLETLTCSLLQFKSLAKVYSRLSFLVEGGGWRVEGGGWRVEGGVKVGDLNVNVNV